MLKGGRSARMTDVRQLIRRDVDAEEYGRIRELWKRHSIAEDARDLPGLISTLTEDCHDAAARSD
jgi:hypothetical protein